MIGMLMWVVYGCIIDRRSLVACNVFAASQCLYQTGVELPALTLVLGLKQTIFAFGWLLSRVEVRH